MAIDYSKFSDSDLEAISSGDMSRVSDEGLALLSGENSPGSMSFAEAAVEGVKTAPRAGVRMLEGMANAVIHLPDTISGVGNLAKGVAQKLLIPGEQEEEKYANAFGDYFANRYLGADNLKRTIASDLPGVAADASLLLTGGAGVVRGGGKAALYANLINDATAAKAARVANLASKTAAVIDPVTGVSTLAGKSLNIPGYIYKATAGMMPEERLMMSTHKKGSLSSRLTPEQQLANAQTAIREGVTTTRSGLEKLHGVMREMDTKIDSLVTEAAKAGDTVPRARIEKEISDLMAVDGPFFHSTKRETAARIVQKKLDTLYRQYPDQIPVEEVQKFKTNTQNLLAKEYGKMSGIGPTVEKAAARGAKQALAEAYPELAALNAKDSTLHNLEKALDSAVTRIDGRDLVSLAMAAKTGAGFAVDAATGGQAGKVVGIAATLADIPMVKSALAIALDRARKAQFTARRPLVYGARESLRQADAVGRAYEEAGIGDAR